MDTWRKHQQRSRDTLQISTTQKTRLSRRSLGARLTLLCAIAASPVAPAQDLAYVCENDGQTRSIGVVRPPGFACRVEYRKSSGTSYPWNARGDPAYCAPKVLSLVGRLKSWGWQCESSENVRSVLAAQIERYHRHIRILKNIGKTCHFYPGEVRYGNLCGDDRPEGATVYSCENGDDEWQQHLAVFVDTQSEPLIIEVGDSRSRQVISYFIDQGRVLLETQSVLAPEGSAATQSVAEDVSIRCRNAPSAGWELYSN